MDLTVAVSTYGHQSWVDLAHERAIPSAYAEGVPVVFSHRQSLADARNTALAQVKTEWVLHLDADDALEEGYIDAMGRGKADVRGPMVRFVQSDERWRFWQPRVFNHQHDCTADCLPQGNWLVIGSAVRTELVRAVGGWRDFVWSEDWDLWLRCYKAGASFELIRDAIYRAWVNPQSRNRGAAQEAKLAAHEAIHRANFPEMYAAA